MNDWLNYITIMFSARFSGTLTLAGHLKYVYQVNIQHIHKEQLIFSLKCVWQSVFCPKQTTTDASGLRLHLKNHINIIISPFNGS